MKRQGVKASKRQTVLNHGSEAMSDHYVDQTQRDLIIVPPNSIPKMPPPSDHKPVSASKPISDDSPDDSKSSMIHGTESNLRPLNRDNSNRVATPAPPLSLTLAGSYRVAEPDSIVEAPGIEL
jgi:hypothetical protein